MTLFRRLTKCNHCDYIDFLEQTKVPARCSDCGAAVIQIENPFETESVKVMHYTTHGERTKIKITFYQCVDRVRNIIGGSLNKVIPDESLRERVLYMAQIYAWVLLKKAPELWHSMDLVINGIKEILTLRLNK